ncbi:MAG TPA: dTMP kinase [Longimicrobiales bacterium]|nr:dTMP kinase [Longimicrobiales bacterium]
MFIVLEGTEGSGKSTQVRLLGAWLMARGLPHILTREPGGTSVGEEIRAILLHGDHIPAETELLLMNAARAAFVAEIVRPALEAGKIVVADRFSLSSLAYQGYGRGLPVEEVRRICGFAAQGVDPDLTIVLDVPLDVSESRRAGRGADRIERAGTEFHNRVAEAYRLLPQTETNVVLLSGIEEPQAVHQRILGLLQTRFPETFSGIAG